MKGVTLAVGKLEIDELFAPGRRCFNYLKALGTLVKVENDVTDRPYVKAAFGVVH